MCRGRSALPKHSSPAAAEPTDLFLQQSSGASQLYLISPWYPFGFPICPYSSKLPALAGETPWKCGMIHAQSYRYACVCICVWVCACVGSDPSVNRASWPGASELQLHTTEHLQQLQEFILLHKHRLMLLSREIQIISASLIAGFEPAECTMSGGCESFSSPHFCQTL